jgi:hypothetical protein
MGPPTMMRSEDRDEKSDTTVCAHMMLQERGLVTSQRRSLMAMSTLAVVAKRIVITNFSQPKAQFTETQNAGSLLGHIPVLIHGYKIILMRLPHQRIRLLWKKAQQMTR